CRPRRLLAGVGVRRGQGGDHLLHQDSRPRDGPPRGDRQHRLPRPHGHRDAPRRRPGPSRRRQGARAPGARGAHETPRPARGRRARGALLRLGGRRLHHRPDAVGERRPDDGLSSLAGVSDRRLKALVTGAAHPGGIGAAIAQRLTAEGLEVVTLDRAPGCTFEVDLVTDALPELDDIDVLISNAGLPTIVGGAHSMDLERWERDLATNLTGSFRVVQACLRGMRERRFGRIVVVSSFAARFGMPAQVAYSASKAGLIGMVKTVAAENAARGITANAILPGLVASAGVRAMPQAITDAWLERIPTGRMVEPAEIAAAAAYLASPDAGSVTGQELLIDGGMTLNLLSVTSSVTRGRSAP